MIIFHFVCMWILFSSPAQMQYNVREMNEHSIAFSGFFFTLNDGNKGKCGGCGGSVIFQFKYYLKVSVWRVSDIGGNAKQLYLTSICWKQWRSRVKSRKSKNPFVKDCVHMKFFLVRLSLSHTFSIAINWSKHKYIYKWLMPLVVCCTKYTLH